MAQLSRGKEVSPTASAKLVARAVDRNAAARAEGITAFLCGGESFNRSSPILIEYVDKMLKTSRWTCLRHHRGKIAAIGLREGRWRREPRKSVGTKR
ncbi:hypothetical protein IVA95_08760 [Bradyrhizobium sp. 157]|uniref:hypothetical protein n=1 Tax=Bradyrhizobium sp. 157 TaxID=2782631 RepID=UPI001FFAAE3A|nr:hypothetical protein [Bradyrhizobium sp. 157]MCK1637678.1 hypothetical protein [Bradyrhizobium sp. 157]